MTHPGGGSDCRAARRALLEATGVVPSHVRSCVSCRRFAAGLVRVDQSLETAARRASALELPPELRVRILAAIGPGSAAPSVRTEPRGRIFDLALRLGAVAAVLTGFALALPGSLSAAELDTDAVRRWTGRIESALRAPESVAIATRDLTPAFIPFEVPFDVPPMEHSVPVGGVALALLASGVGLLLRERGR